MKRCHHDGVDVSGIASQIRKGRSSVALGLRIVAFVIHLTKPPLRRSARGKWTAKFADGVRTWHATLVVTMVLSQLEVWTAHVAEHIAGRRKHLSYTQSGLVPLAGLPRIVCHHCTRQTNFWLLLDDDAYDVWRCFRVVLFGMMLLIEVCSSARFKVCWRKTCFTTFQQIGHPTSLMLGFGKHCLATSMRSARGRAGESNDVVFEHTVRMSYRG